MIADAAHFVDGIRRQEGALTLEQAQRSLGEGLVWVSLIDPTDLELAEIQERFGLHPVAVEDAGNPNQRPKLQEYREHFFVVLRTARYNRERDLVEFGDIHAFVGPHFVVVVRHGRTSPLADARHRVEAQPDLAAHDPPALLWALLDKVVDDYEPVMAQLEEDIEEVERSIFEGGGDQTQRIYLLRRELANFYRAAHPLLAPLEAMGRGEHIALEDELRVYFRAVADHLRRLHDEVVNQRELLDGVFQAHLALIGLRQNAVVRKVSSWAAIITVPTLIASIYGMNFERMPELGWVLGYPFALVLMIACAGGLWSLLRRMGWL